MFCEDCGTQIDSTSQFCSHCGARFTTRLAEARTGEQPLPSHRNNKPTKRLQTILVLSIPAGLIALVVVWLLSGVVESRREGFEKFLPENTAYYVEIHDPIGLVADFEQSAFYKRLTASPEWKEADISNSDLRKFKDVLSRLTAVRNVVGPAGLASVPSFSETGALVFVRIERDYIGAARLNLEQFLDSQNVKYRKNQRAGRIRYDLETTPNSSLLLTGFGIIGAESPGILDKYIDWLETSAKTNLGSSANFKKINSRKSGANARGRIYLDSSSFLNSLSKGAGPTAFGSIADFPSLVGKAEVGFHDGISLSSSFYFSQESSLTKNILQAVQKPISNTSLKHMPKDVIAFSTVNLMAVWEFAKEEVRRQGVGGRQGEAEKLLQTLSGEALFALVPGAQQTFSWDGGIVVGAEQKASAGFITALEEFLPEIKSIHQIERYGGHDIRCYPSFFGTALCLANVDNFVFASTNKQAIYKILDVKDGKAAAFQQTINANAKLNRLFAGNRHGITYVNLKDIARNIPVALWGNPRELAIKEKFANAPSPFYLAGATDVSGDIFNGEAILVFDVLAFEDLFIGLAEVGALAQVFSSMPAELKRTGVTEGREAKDKKEGGRLSSGGPHSASIVPLSNVRSLESRIRSEVIFENRLREPVLIFWVNFQGQEVLFKELNPRESYSIQSFVTHPWRVRMKGTRQPVKEIVANSQREVLIIE